MQESLISQLIREELHLLKLDPNKRYDYYSQGNEIIGKGFTKAMLMKVYDSYDGTIKPSKASTLSLNKKFKEHIVQTLKEEANPKIQKLNDRIQSLQSRITRYNEDKMKIDNDIADIKSEISDIKAEIADLKAADNEE